MRAGLPILFVAFGQLCAVAVAQGQQEQPAALKQMLRTRKARRGRPLSGEGIESPQSIFQQVV